MNFKLKILLIIIVIMSTSFGMYIFISQRNIKIQNNTNINDVSKKEEVQKKEQWNKILGKGDTVIGDGENILKDKF